MSQDVTESAASISTAEPSTLSGSSPNRTPPNRTASTSRPRSGDASDETPDDVDVGVVVAMPAYNEEGTVGAVVDAVRPHADLVLVVDDGSDDDTAAEAARTGALVVRHSTNRGYGGALKTIFAEAAAREANHLVVVDADGQHTVSDIPRLVATQVETGANVVIGSRFVEGATTDAPLYRRFGLWVINTLTNLSLGTYRSSQRLSDAQSGFRAYDTLATRSLAADETIGDCMAASLDILYHVHRNGYTTAEIGTTITYDVDHANSQNPLTQGFDLLSAIATTTLRDRPLLALGLPGVAVAFFGLFVSLFLLAPAASVELVAAFSVVTLSGVGLCGLGFHRHLSTRPSRASESGSVSASSPGSSHTLSED